MPIVKCHWKNIFPKLTARATLVALAMALAAGAQAQTWSILPVKVSPDDSWGPKYDKGPSRLVTDAQGSVYLSMKDSLHIGTYSALIWATAPITKTPLIGIHTPVSAGANGTVLWGAWSSLDRGATWDTAGSNSRTLWPTAHAIAPGGYSLFGGSYDAVVRSETPCAKGTRMHMGKTYGSILDIAISPAGANAYAAPQYDELLVSRDSGKTWKEKSAVLKSDVSRPNAEDLVTGVLAIESGSGTESLWMAGDFRRNSHPTRVMEYRWVGDSLVAFHHANASLPDSPFTVLRVQQAGCTILWMGTWGQGLFRSVDRGESWQQYNMGLNDLHVEDVAIGPDGKAYVLTRQGLFTMTIASAILPSRHVGRRSGSASDRNGFFGNSVPLFGIGSGMLFGADGRKVRAASLPFASTPR